MQHLDLPTLDATGTDFVIDALRRDFGNRLQTGQAIRDQHCHTTTWLRAQPPDAVVYPHSTQEVQRIVRLCAAERVPIIPFGAGTSLEGQVNAPQGGITVDLSQMAQVLEVRTGDLDCRVQPGVTRKQLNGHLRDAGLFFAVDPGADATLGGMASTRASGTNAVRYGTMRDAVLGLTAVLPSGEVITTGRRARKTSAGYDLTRLLIGAEGTLGLITELNLRLYGLPEAISVAICSFGTVQAACDAAIAMLQYGIPVARMELLDAMTVGAVNDYSGLNLPLLPLLLLEFHGSMAGVADQAATFGDVAADHGARGFQWTGNVEERSRLWRARHDAYWAVQRLRPGLPAIATDVCVPISQLAGCVTQAQAKATEMGLLAPTLGHVGDGNFHMVLQIDPTDPEERGRATRFMDWLAELAVSHDGTCTGEHGIGQGKTGYLATELGEAAVDMMRVIKRAIDPFGIMNPGKIFDMAPPAQV